MILKRLNSINPKDMQEDLIIGWLMGQDDPFLQEAIKKCPDEDFSKCNNYIMEQAKKVLEGKSGYLKDDVVFGFAKEYFVDYEARKQKEAELKKANEEKALKQRIADTLTSVKNQRDTLINNNYNELYEKYKLDLISWENELRTGLVKDDKRVNEINKGLAAIIDEIDKLRKPLKEVKVEEEKEESFGGLFDIEL